MVFSETLDVLAGNRLAVAMHSGFEDPTNLALMTFADPAGATFYPGADLRGEAFPAPRRRRSGIDLSGVRRPGSDGQQLVVYRAARGSRTEASLSLLASLSAPYAAADE